MVKVGRADRPQDTGPDLSGEHGLREAWEAHATELRGYATRALGDTAAADEVVQETFLRAWRAAERYDPSRPLRPWLFAILRHLVVDETRARQVRDIPVPREVTDATGGGDGDEQLDRVMDGWLMGEAMLRIRPEHAFVLQEIYVQGRSYAAVGLELGIPEGTARSRAFYALRTLRATLEEMGWEP